MRHALSSPPHVASRAANGDAAAMATHHTDTSAHRGRSRRRSTLRRRCCRCRRATVCTWCAPPT
eukprot:28494-Chlamydomonas_euryale.AAC.1